MGRNYFGDISGKFWFGIQCSSDIEKLICTLNESHTIKYCWLGCGCRVTLGEDKVPYTDYCHLCYDGKNKHIEDIEDNNLAEEDSINGESTKMIAEDNHFIYEITKDEHYQLLCDSLNLLSSYLSPNIFKELNDIEVTWDDSILDSHSGVYDRIYELSRDLNLSTERDNNNMREKIARYCHGLQVKYCLEKLGYCSFSAEI